MIGSRLTAYTRPGASIPLMPLPPTRNANMELQTEAALLRLVTDTDDETRAAPKLNCGTLEKPVGLFDSFVVVSANEAPVSNKMFLRSDEIGPVIWHGAAPLY